MSLQEILLPLVPGLLRFYRTRLTLDFNAVLFNLPESGTLLDVGCGSGGLIWEVGRRRPRLQILALDTDPKILQEAVRFHHLPNIRYLDQPMEDLEGSFDCVSFIDVFHHVSDEKKMLLFLAGLQRLKPQGYLLVKDVVSNSEDPAYWMDRYVSGCKRLWFSTPEGLPNFLPEGLEVRDVHRKYRFPFLHYYMIIKPVALQSVVH